MFYFLGVSKPCHAPAGGKKCFKMFGLRSATATAIFKPYFAIRKNDFIHKLRKSDQIQCSSGRRCCNRRRHHRRNQSYHLQSVTV